MVNLAVRSLGVAAGLVADRAWGEPPLRPHPVAVFGSAMALVEDGIYRDRRSAGVAHAVIGIGLGALVGRAMRSTATATYLAVAGRALGDAAESVHEALVVDDLDEARVRLQALVGRNTDELSESEVVRAVVESVAENTVDAVVAPALWAGVAGAPGVLGHRAVNTLDAMVGYRTPRYLRFGWASARLDDAAAWVPARVAALLVMVVRPRAAGEVLRTVRRDARAHPSPNGGVVEAAFAAALGVRLGGESTYGACLEQRPWLGAGATPTVGDIDRAIRLSRDVGLALAGSFAAAPAAVWLVRHLAARGGRHS
ncbi:MAG: cobalamin biosynthesis protein CobD [Actinobacteria bacterium]|nr:cobalamin biosynthesis protein CobD [Actinomycetota bacterium]